MNLKKTDIFTVYLNMSQFNVLIVGNAGTGKTNFISQAITGNFNNQYIPTFENRCHRYRYNSIDIDFQDTCGQHKFSDNLPEGHFDLVLIFGASYTLKTVDFKIWYKNVTNQYSKEIPKIEVINEFSKSWSSMSSHPQVDSYINVKSREGIKDLLEKIYNTLVKNSNQTKIVDKNNIETMNTDIKPDMEVDDIMNGLQNILTKKDNEIEYLRKELSRKNNEIKAFKVQLIRQKMLKKIMKLNISERNYQEKIMK